MPASVRTLLRNAKHDIEMNLALDVWLGLGMALDSGHRYAAQAFDPARSLMPIRSWGILLTVLTALLIASLVSGRQLPYEICSWSLRTFYGLWMGVFIYSFVLGNASHWSVGFSTLWFVRCVRMPLENPWGRYLTRQ
jgi:hypothetical protein